MTRFERGDRSGRATLHRSGGALSRRRETARRRWARRHLGLLAVFGAAVVVAVLVAVVVSGGRSPRRPPVAASPAAGVAADRRSRRGANRVRSERRAVERALALTSYVELAGRRRREIALTFDDGPGPFTQAIVGVLVRMRAPATFFLIGRSATRYPQLVVEELRDGFEVGDHSETHPFLSRLSAAAQTAEIQAAAVSIHRAGERWPRLLRPPYGSFDQATLRILAELRVLMVLWSADTKDYTRPGVKRIIYTAVSGAQPGAIILMHDGPAGADRSQTLAALPRIITRLRQRGFRLVTISQLLADDRPPANQPPPRQLSGRG